MGAEKKYLQNRQYRESTACSYQNLEAEICIQITRRHTSARPKCYWGTTSCSGRWNTGGPSSVWLLKQRAWLPLRLLAAGQTAFEARYRRAVTATGTFKIKETRKGQIATFKGGQSTNVANQQTEMWKSAESTSGWFHRLKWTFGPVRSKKNTISSFYHSADLW